MKILLQLHIQCHIVLVKLVSAPSMRSIVAIIIFIGFGVGLWLGLGFRIYMQIEQHQSSLTVDFKKVATCIGNIRSAEAHCMPIENLSYMKIATRFSSF